MPVKFLSRVSPDCLSPGAGVRKGNIAENCIFLLFGMSIFELVRVPEEEKELLRCELLNRTKIPDAD